MRFVMLGALSKLYKRDLPSISCNSCSSSASFFIKNAVIRFVTSSGVSIISNALPYCLGKSLVSFIYSSANKSSCNGSQAFSLIQAVTIYFSPNATRSAVCLAAGCNLPSSFKLSHVKAHPVKGINDLSTAGNVVQPPSISIFRNIISVLILLPECKPNFFIFIESKPS